MISRLLLVLLFSLNWTAPAFAFYESSGELFSQDARGLLYSAAGNYDGNETGTISARLIYDANSDHFNFEYHQVWQEVFATENQYTTQTDRLNISYSHDKFYLKVGRQAINLATTFFFSPNDFFAPFSLQTFNRDYKQGVDALYSEFELGGLSQLTALMVNNRYDEAATSSIVRIESAFANISWMLFSGEIGQVLGENHRVTGGSFSTDLWDSIGFRGEGHINVHGGRSYAEWVLSAEHQWSNQFNLTTEWFNHGAKAPTSTLPYFASQYLAVGISYPYSPLLTLSLNSIRNMDDDSSLHTSYINYSLSNDATLSFYALSSSGSVISEFGNYPSTTGLELLYYF